MKKLSLTVIACAMLILSTSKVHAQKMSFGLTVGSATPMGAFGDAPLFSLAPPNLVATASSGFSVGLHGRYYLNDNIAVGLNVAYTRFNAQSFSIVSSTGTFTAIPVMAAFDYYFRTDNFAPYAGIELGYIHTSASSTVNNSTANVSSGGLALAPVIGVRYELSERFGLLANLKYMFGMNEHKFDVKASNDFGFPATTYLGINVGVNYTIDN